MSEAAELVVGLPDGDHVRVVVVGRERPDAMDSDDGNWLVTPVELRVGRFRAELPADLRAEELRRFRQELEAIYASLSGEAVLDSLDGWITLTVSCDLRGRLTANGVVDDQPGIGNKLSFSFDGLDQSHIPAMLTELHEIERRFPVR